MSNASESLFWLRESMHEKGGKFHEVAKLRGYGLRGYGGPNYGVKSHSCERVRGPNYWAKSHSCEPLRGRTGGWRFPGWQGGRRRCGVCQLHRPIRRLQLTLLRWPAHVRGGLT